MSPLRAPTAGATTASASFFSAIGIPNLAVCVRARANTINRCNNRCSNQCNNRCNSAGGKPWCRFGCLTYRSFATAGELTMKTILVPTQNIPAMKSTLETAVLLAERAGSYIEGVPLWFGAPEFVVAELASSFSIETFRARREEEAAEARKLFETFMREHGVAAAKTTADRPWFSWFAEVPPGESLVGSHGRVFDVIVMSRPAADTIPLHNRAIESGLFESGRPVLLAPPTAPKQIATNIMIHWNGSTEQARTNAFAMPLLRLAERVTLLTVVGGQEVPGPSANQVLGHLQYNGIPAEPMSIELDGRSTGEAILAAAKAQGCDLLIKGAFTRNRLRQMIFGGATSHVIEHAELPLLMAH